MNKPKSAIDTDLETFSENFQRTVQAIRGALKEEEITALAKCETFDETFGLLWHLNTVHEVYSLEEEFEGKCSTSAKEFRDKGNGYFSNKAYLTALKEYNSCIFKAPHPTTPHSTTPHSTTPHSTTPHPMSPHSTSHAENTSQNGTDSEDGCQELSLAYGNRFVGFEVVEYKYNTIKIQIQINTIQIRIQIKIQYKYE